MRVIIFGAGAVGATVGARLFLADQEVALIARGVHGERMRDEGLRFRTPDEDMRLRIPTALTLDALQPRPDDLVLLSVKSQHTLDALAALESWSPDCPVVCAQNGVANERMAARRFARVYAMLVYLPATLLEPGQVRAYCAPRSGVLHTGCWPSGVDDTVEALCAALRRGGFAARPDPDVMRLKYSKLLTNLANAAQALCGFPEGRELALAAQAEGRAVLQAAGVAFMEPDALRARCNGERSAFRPIGDDHRPGGSSWQSLARGCGDIEADWLNGEIVMMGREVGAPTPVNAALRRAAARAAREGWAPAALSPAQVMASSDR